MSLSVKQESLDIEYITWK